MTEHQNKCYEMFDIAGIAQLGEQQTEVLEVACSIHAPGIAFSSSLYVVILRLLSEAYKHCAVLRMLLEVCPLLSTTIPPLYGICILFNQLGILYIMMRLYTTEVAS